MCCLETTLEKLANSYFTPHTAGPDGSATSYSWKGSQINWAPKATVDLVNLITSWGNTGNCFCDGAPKPKPELRIGPKV